MRNRTQSVTHGKCRLFHTSDYTLSECLDAGTAVLFVRPDSGKWSEYFVKCQRNERGGIVGFTLEKIVGHVEEAAVQYYVDCSFGPLAAHWFCSCKSDEYRRPGAPPCKHIRSLFSTLSAAGLLSVLPSARAAVATAK